MRLSLRKAARGSVTPTSFTGNPGPSWAILSRPYGTDRDKTRALICFQRVPGRDWEHVGADTGFGFGVGGGVGVEADRFGGMAVGHGGREDQAGKLFPDR